MIARISDAMRLNHSSFQMTDNVFSEPYEPTLVEWINKDSKTASPKIRFKAVVIINKMMKNAYIDAEVARNGQGEVLKKLVNFVIIEMRENLNHVSKKFNRKNTLKIQTSIVDNRVVRFELVAQDGKSSEQVQIIFQSVYKKN